MYNKRRMEFKQLIRLFVPPIYHKVKHLLCPKKQTELCPLPKNEHQGDRMVIIGNGPSLNKTIELYESQLHEADCIMVNFSANSDLYEKIKPTFYMLVDPLCYKMPKHLYNTLGTLFNAIVTKTNWSMKIIMPKCAIGCYAVDRFKENPNIEVLFYEDGWKIPKEISKYEAWDKNLISPPSQTVLNTAVWLSIYWGYKETYLVGADTSFLADLRVDQETNILYTEDTHYYSNKDIYSDNYDSVKQRRPIETKLYEELFSIGTALKYYWDMKAYADWKGVKVYNASEYSWIDAFERKKLK